MSNTFLFSILARREVAIEKRLSVAVDEEREWIVQLYEAWGKPDKAAEWRQK